MRSLAFIAIAMASIIIGVVLNSLHTILYSAPSDAGKPAAEPHAN